MDGEEFCFTKRLKMEKKPKVANQIEKSILEESKKHVTRFTADANREES